MNQEFENKGLLCEIIDESPSVKRFIIEAEGAEVFDFTPGQFVIISFPGIEHKFPYRSYSIASAPAKNRFELCVVLKEDGAATPVLFSMKVGDRLIFSKPLGNFVLPEDVSDKHLCLICTGTGIAPFRAMIQHLINQKQPHGNITLIFGCRTQKDLLYRKEFEELETSCTWFRYIPVLSRENWSGRQGYVHQVYLNNPEFTDRPDRLFYICGWSQMVREAKNNLKAMGYSRKQVKFELYD